MVATLQASGPTISGWMRLLSGAVRGNPVTQQMRFKKYEGFWPLLTGSLSEVMTFDGAFHTAESWNFSWHSTWSVAQGT
jgi:hypothetical protein